MNRLAFAARPEYVLDVDDSAFGVIQKPLSLGEKLYNTTSLRKILLILLLATAWQLYATVLDNSLLFPTLTDTLGAFYDNLLNGVLLQRSWTSIKVLLVGYSVGLLLAAILAAFAMSWSIGNDFLETLTAMFNPLPAIALLPLALIWFGLGNGSLVFVLVHSVLWPIALNTHSGFTSVSPTLRMVGRNYGLTGLRYITLLLMPAAFPSILAGLKIGWAFSWRTLIAAELVFGVASGSGGLGWFIYEKKNLLEIPSVFAGLLSVILIGLFVEYMVFQKIEAVTVRRWGMQT